MGLLLAILLASCGTPRACESQVEQGRVLIRDLHEEEALRLLEPLSDDASLSATVRGRANIYAGIAWMDLGNEDRAKHRFRVALAADPGAALPSWVSRRVRATYNAVAAEAPPKLTPEHLPETPSAAAPAPMPALTQTASPAPPRKSTTTAIWLGVGAGVLAVGAIASYAHWSSVHSDAQHATTASKAQSLDSDSKPYWYAFEALTAGAVGVGAGALLAWKF